MTTIHLYKHTFSEQKRVLLETPDFTATTYTYPSGVQALQLENNHGHLILLPFQGQQIWDAVLSGRRLTMKTMFEDPKPTQNYLENYGGLLLHCGITAMGVPSSSDTHPLHGELPNAPFQTAILKLGSDENGHYIALSGTYQHTVAFAHNYIATPEIRFYANSTTVNIQLSIKNLKNSPMDLMYLAHLNLRPINEAELIYSAIISPQTIRIRSSIPSHVKISDEALQQLEQLKHNPELHHKLTTGISYDPEIVFIIDYHADQNGWAHSLQIHPDGSADYVTHRPNQLPVGVRWLTRTPDQDGLGLVLPATAEPLGYNHEKAAGRIISLAARATWNCEYQLSVLSANQVPDIKNKVLGMMKTRN
jgi:hypothetical protein